MNLVPLGFPNFLEELGVTHSVGISLQLELDALENPTEMESCFGIGMSM